MLYEGYNNGHFTTKNSPPLSDPITDVRVEPVTGEVLWREVLSLVRDGSSPPSGNVDLGNQAMVFGEVTNEVYTHYLPGSSFSSD